MPAIIQDAENNQVLMMAWMNKESLLKTLETGNTVFWSRSRQKFWMKGETSGHTQKVVAMYLDCDGDTLLIKVNQKGAACHEGYRSCFFRKIDEKDYSLVVCEKQLESPEKIYKKKNE